MIGRITFRFFIRGDDGRVGFSTTDSKKGLNDFFGKTPVNDGKWHFVCAVYDGSDKILYVDGVEDGRRPNAHSGKALGSGLIRYGFIGDGSEARDFDGLRNEVYYEGTLDEISLYARVLSVDEIQSTYADQESEAGLASIDSLLSKVSSSFSELPSLLESIVSHTIYEDAEDGTIAGWLAYGDGRVVNVEDLSGNRIISTEGWLIGDPFRLGLDDESDWNNTEEFTAYFAILMEEEAAVYFRVDTSEGEKYLCYTSSLADLKIFGDALCFSLEAEADGDWHEIYRDLAGDLDQAIPGARLFAVKDFYVFGSVKLDNTMLLKLQK